LLWPKIIKKLQKCQQHGNEGCGSAVMRQPACGEQALAIMSRGQAADNQKQ
jgi:hypothetical protein